MLGINETTVLVSPIQMFSVSSTARSFVQAINWTVLSGLNCFDLTVFPPDFFSVVSPIFFLQNCADLFWYNCSTSEIGKQMQNNCRLST